MKKQKFLTSMLVAAMALSTMTANFSSVSATSISSTNSKKAVSEHSRVVEKENIPDVSIATSDELGKMQRTINKMQRSSVNSVTETFTGFLEAEGDTTYLMLTLAPGEIIQATLAGPNDASINYDILLYTVDDGNLGTCVASCALDTYMNKYSDGKTKSVEDALSYIHSGEYNQSYALFVLASSGYSDTEPFSLTVSIDEEGYYDDAEPNDNPFNAVTITTGQKVTGNNLNVSNDQDWYVWRVPSTIYGVSMNLSKSSYAAEIYYAIDDGSMVLVQSTSSGIYKLGSGYYYVRVHNASDNFVSSDYTLSFQPYGNTASKISVAFNGDQGSNKVNYGAGSYYRAKSKISPTVTVLDSSGYPVVGQSVTLVWQSGCWSENSGNFERKQTLITNSSGKATFSLSLPPAMGKYSYVGGSAITFEHYYDTAAFGVFCGNISNTQPMYHFAYSSYA